MMSQPSWFLLSSREAAVRASLASVAIWWVVFSIPLFRHVPEPAALRRDGVAPGLAIGAAVKGLVETLRELRRYRQAFLLLLAFLIYNDGIQTIIRMATVYGSEIQISTGAMITALVLV